MDRAVLERMALARLPRALVLAPPEPVQGAVFLAVAGLPNPPTIREMAHWTELTERHVKRAVDRLRARALIEPAGRVTRDGKGLQTYQVAPCRISS